VRATTILVWALLAVCVALYWIPLPPIPLGSSNLVLGGYPWNAPEPARGFFVALGIGLTVAAAALAILAFLFGREDGTGLEEELEL